MGIVPEQDSARNQELITDYKSGMGTVEMVAKYQISTSRIYEILEKYNVKKRKKAKKK